MPDSKIVQLSQPDLTTVPETPGDDFVEIDLSAPTVSENDDFVEVDLNQPAIEPVEEFEELPDPVAEIPPINEEDINQINQVGAPETLSATPLGLEIGDELALKTGTSGEGKNEKLVGKKKLLFEEYNRDADKVSVDADGERLEFSRAEFENLFQLLPESVSAGPAEAEEGLIKNYSFDLGGGAAETEEQTAITGATNPIENEANTHLDIEVGQEWQDPDLGGLYIEKIKTADGKGILGIKFKNTDEIREATTVWGEFFKQMTLGSETSVPENGTGSNITREVEEKIDDLALEINSKIILNGAAETYESGKKVQTESAEHIPVVPTLETDVVIPPEEVEAEKEVAQVVESAVPQVVEEERREDASDSDATAKLTSSDRHAEFRADTKRSANSVDAAKLEEEALASGESENIESSGDGEQA